MAVAPMDPFADLKAEVKRIGRVIDGDETSDTPGMRPRLKAVEGTVASLVTQHREIKVLLRGISIGVGLASIPGIVQLVELGVQIFGP